jgi:integrase/recombinase XerD
MTAQPTTIPDGAKTLAWLLADYLEHLASLRYSGRTLHKKRLLLSGLLRWLAHGWEVTTSDAIQPHHLETWQKHLSARTSERGLPLHASSINSTIGTAKSFLTWLAEHGYVLKTLAVALKRVREPQLLPQSILAHDDMMKLMRKWDTSTPEGYRNRTLAELLYTSGIRAAEALDLDLADVNLEYATAQVLGKGSKERVVPIGRTARRYLETYIKAVRPFLLREPGEQALFLTKTGHRLAYHNLKYMLQTHVARLALETKVTPHTFRRSCATEMIRGGANVYHVKELLGHETLNTMKHYARLTIVDLKKTHEKCHPREKGGTPDGH